MSIFDNKIVIWIGFMIIIYTLFRLLNKPNDDFEKEVEEIISSDKHKVKGQYD